MGESAERVEEVAHTPGPWRVEVSPIRKTLCVFGGPQFDTWICGELVSHNETRIDTAECQANARLIAAAPDMLAVLEEISADLEVGENSATILARHTLKLNAAVAKAAGKELVDDH